MDFTPERRIKPRVACDYPVLVEGYDSEGSQFNENGNLANLSASGLFMKTNRYIENGSKISVTVLLTNTPIEQETPRIATYGIVVRTESQAEGTCGIAMKFNSYRFL